MTLDGWRRTLQALNHHDAATMIQPTGHVFAHLPAHLVVVGTDEGGIFPGIGLALEHDDGDAAVVGPVDGRRNGLHLIRGHDEQVDARLDQTVNLLHLTLVAVVGSGKAQLHALLEIRSQAQLGILLLAPDVFRALRHADDVTGGLSATPKAQHEG